MIGLYSSITQGFIPICAEMGGSGARRVPASRPQMSSGIDRGSDKSHSSGGIARLKSLWGSLSLGERAQSSASGLASLFIGLMIAGIIAVQVFIPVINDAIGTANVSGTTQTILELLPLFAGLLLLIALASPLMSRT